MSGKFSKISHIVRLRQMLRRWRTKARMSSPNRAPSDVPAGHVAVCVGTNYTRFVVRATYLNHPIFHKLLVQAEDEYGFSNYGPLTIPCDEDFFEEALRFISRSGSKNGPNRFININVEDIKERSHMGIRNNVDFWPERSHMGIRNNVDFWPESRPLLHDLSEKTPEDDPYPWK